MCWPGAPGTQAAAPETRCKGRCYVLEASDKGWAALPGGQGMGWELAWIRAGRQDAPDVAGCHHRPGGWGGMGQTGQDAAHGWWSEAGRGLIRKPGSFSDNPNAPRQQNGKTSCGGPRGRSFTQVGKGQTTHSSGVGRRVW